MTQFRFWTTTLLLTSSLSSTVMAGGYQLQEYSVTNLGRSFGGAGIFGDDYSAIAFNPAGMVLKGSGLQVGNSTIRIRSRGEGNLKNVGGNTLGEGRGHMRTLANLPHFFAQKKLSDNWVLGTGFYVPFGLGTYYRKRDWFAANHAVNSEIQALDGELALSYRMNQYFSLGAGFIMEYLDARLTNDIFHPANGATIGNSDMNADGWKSGFNAGMMFEPSENTRFGISYRSKIAHRIKGSHYFNLGGAYVKGTSQATLSLPEHVLLSAYHRIGKATLSAMARWTKWSRFNILTIKSTTPTGISQVNEDWRNVWMIGGGVDYDLTKNWTVRMGASWDQGAVKRPETRTARVPDSNRILATLGASYKTGAWQWDAAYAHMFWKTSWVNNTASNTTLSAKYRTGIDILGVGLQYHF